MTAHDALFTLASLAEERAVDPLDAVPIPRRELFASLWPHARSAVAGTLRGMLNEWLRELQRSGFVELTRTTVTITTAGINEAWS